MGLGALEGLAGGERPPRRRATGQVHEPPVHAGSPEVHPGGALEQVPGRRGPTRRGLEVGEPQQGVDRFRIRCEGLLEMVARRGRLAPGQGDTPRAHVRPDGTRLHGQHASEAILGRVELSPGQRLLAQLEQRVAAAAPVPRRGGRLLGSRGTSGAGEREEEARERAAGE